MARPADRSPTPINQSTKAAPIRVVLVDDHLMVLQSLLRMVDRERDMTVVATATNAGDGIRVVADNRPDVTILDYQLPDMDGGSVTRRILEEWPEARVVMLTGTDRDEAAFDAVESGCVGYLEKTRAAGDLVRMLRSVHQGSRELPVERFGQLPKISELAVHYQPIVNLQSRDIVGVEALVRWQHPSRGLLDAGQFIALAERTHLIQDIDSTVREEAALQLAEWHRDSLIDRSLFVSVNLSGRELQMPDLVPRIASLLVDTELDASSLMLEVTETFIIDDSRENERKLHRLKDLGVRIALDDFGTAYSSLQYFRRFPIDLIKLDKSFIDSLPFSARALRLIEAVGRLASDMGVGAEAEGIETEGQAEQLLSLGWQLGQGYLFARPADAKSISALLAQQEPAPFQIRLL